ncbi:glycosyltransferase [Cetobacterium somerae]|uniref:glycosyltransferase n=1 Tax=Cetobacterium somerae TaxID=188913 RepID=UPI003892482A
MRKLYDEIKPDIIHTHLESVTFNTAMGLLGKGAKQIQTIHSIKISYPKIQRFFLNNVLEKNIAISKEVKLSMIEKKFNKNKIKEIPNAINLNKFKNNEKKFQIPKIYLAVGRLGKEKNHELLIRAYSKFIKNIENVEKKPVLKIVGDGVEKEKLKKLIEELKMNNFIKLLGVKDNIPELLKEADVYLMTSKWEGFSISLIEAAASGLPIIATDVGSNSLICKNNTNGWIFDSEDEEELINLLEKMQKLDLMNLKKFSENSIKISNQYDLEEISKELLKTYFEVKRKK